MEKGRKIQVNTKGGREGRMYLSRALKHLSLGVRAIDDIIRLSNLLHLLLGMGHPYQIAKVGVLEGVARCADFAVDLEAAAYAAGEVSRKGGRGRGREKR